ncbi:MAG: 4-(cytidine 5'-diphospho)-2-C-methyl-D-erythritol kinase [Clostridiales bacterium]|nr:4-(cytidine 5'-diphospho)-2-C-methyl-D-erythritol kinase [Clostridiales bacterium]
MILEAFAKINWSLDITGVREDGYHLMDMIMQPVSLADEITLIPAPFLSITTGGWPPSRADKTNLAYRAALALKNETGYPGGVRIHVEKHIPIGAGMGGGSTDAAAVLIGLNRMWNTGLTQDSLERVGLSLGADVPFFIRGGLTRTRGIGEILENRECMYNYWLVAIQPCPGLSTAQVFSLWHRSGQAHRPDTEKALHALETGSLATLCSNLGNVLQPVSESLRPEISRACEALSAGGASFAGMTGSGSAVFGVFRSSAYAESAYRKLSPDYRTIFLCHTQHDSVRITSE